MTDNVAKIKGKFNVLLLDDNDNIVDEYTDNNLIVDLSKAKMAAIIGKLTTSTYINGVKLGGNGVKPGTIIPKDESDGFNTTRTQLFASEANTYVYGINFTPTGVNGAEATITSESDTGTGAVSTVSVTNLTNVVKFSFTIPKENANNGVAYAYSEAGLYIDNMLFAMKLFPTRVKTNSLKMIINWSIIF